MSKITATIEAPETITDSSELDSCVFIRDLVNAEAVSLDDAEKCVVGLLPEVVGLHPCGYTGWAIYRGGHHIAVHVGGRRVLLIGEVEEEKITEVEEEKITERVPVVAASGPTYHLLKDFGVYKATLKKNFFDNDLGPEHDTTLALLEKRTQRYTADELELLLAWLWTSADDCVCDYPDEANPLQVWTAENKIANGKRVLKYFAELTGRDKPDFGEDD